MDNKDREMQLLKERMREISNYGSTPKPIQETSIKGSTLIEYKKAGDGYLYGIVKENQSYFIKKATPSSQRKPDVTDFVYIGGESNKNRFRYDALNETVKILNSKLVTINESFGHVYETEEEEKLPIPEPIPVPDEGSPEGGAPAPSPEGPEASAPSPEGGEGEAPAPSPEGPEGGAPEGGEEQGDVSLDGGQESELDPINKAKSHIGKAGNYIRTSKTSAEMTKQLANMFLGYLDLGSLSLEDKQEIVDQLNNKGGDEDGIEEDEDFELELNEEQMPDAHTIAAIVAGVSSVFGGAFAIDKLMGFLKSKFPSVAKEVESIGKGAGAGIIGGNTSKTGTQNESRIFGENDEDEEDIDLIGDLEGEVDMEDDVENVEIDGNVEGDVLSVPSQTMGIKSGSTTISVDSKSGKVDVSLSEQMIKNLSKKSGVSEQKIINKLYDIILEEKKQKEAKLVKEERVKLTVRNIIKEKLGLKKKVLKEGKESPVRLKLEKMVESALKKNGLIKESKKK